MRPQRQRLRNATPDDERATDPSGGLRRGDADDLWLARRPDLDLHVHVLHDVDVDQDVPAKRLLQRMVVRHRDEQMPGAPGDVHQRAERLPGNRRRRGGPG
jgi:hypothetical protein